MTESVTPASGAAAYYAARLEAIHASLKAEEERESTISFTRLALFAAALVIAWLAISRELFSAAWVGAPLLAFVPLLVLHERLRRRRAQLQRAAAFFDRGMARLEDRWSGLGSDGAAFKQEASIAEDLDLFGRASVFQLLSVARTATGERTLANWLQNPASPAEILARQQSVRELVTQVDVAEEMAMHGEEARRATASRSLLEWSSRPPVHFGVAQQVAASLLAASAVGTVVYWFNSGNVWPLLVVLIAHALYTASIRTQISAAIGDVDTHLHELTLLSNVLAQIEKRRFESPLLAERFGARHATGASQHLQQLIRLIDLYDARRNQFFALFGILLLWREHLAFRFAAWRIRHGAAFREWIDAVGLFEALLSLAVFSYERPENTFPEIAAEGVSFDATNLKHPLIARAVSVGNDVRLGSDVPLWIVSGSNMSGKSTLLRSIGTNVTLALAGSTVCADRLRVPVLRIGASIRVNDSLEAGSSRFYAEVNRLKEIVDLARGATPLLFLLDEILAGTNSHDRRIGAEGVIRKLVELGAIGLVTTHDLALAQIVSSLTVSARNVHFEDHLENGRMIFDYTVKDGVVTRSNALELMRAVGLEV